MTPFSFFFVRCIYARRIRSARREKGKLDIIENRKSSRSYARRARRNGRNRLYFKNAVGASVDARVRELLKFPFTLPFILTETRACRRE